MQTSGITINFDYLKFGGDVGLVSLSGKRVNGLINRNNIHKADKRLIPDNLSALTVYIAHVTRDVIVDDIPAVLQQIANTPFSGIMVRPYRNSVNGNLQSIVLMSDYRKGKAGKSLYLTFYDKFEESGDERYKNILRIEQKICTFAELRKGFDIRNNDLNSVLNAGRDPIKETLLKFYSRIEKAEQRPLQISDFKIRLYEAYFSLFNFNWSEIESDIKLCGKSGYHKRKAQQIFIEIMNKRNVIDYKKLFDTLLSRI